SNENRPMKSAHVQPLVRDCNQTSCVEFLNSSSGLRLLDRHLNKAPVAPTKAISKRRVPVAGPQKCGSHRSCAISGRSEDPGHRPAGDEVSGCSVNTATSGGQLIRTGT